VIDRLQPGAEYLGKKHAAIEEIASTQVSQADIVRPNKIGRQ
jgi:hypothetical protein